MEQFFYHWADFHEIVYLNIFRKSVKIQISLKSGKNNGTLHEDQYTFLITSCSVLLRIRNVSDEIWRDNEDKDSFNTCLFFFENPAVYEIMWKTSVEPGRPHMTIWRMRIAC